MRLSSFRHSHVIFDRAIRSFRDFTINLLQSFFRADNHRLEAGDCPAQGYGLALKARLVPRLSVAASQWVHDFFATFRPGTGWATGTFLDRR